MYAPENPKVGQVVVSRMGHDKGRLYLIIAVVGGDMALCTDGNARPLDKPKVKRYKHLKLLGEDEGFAAAIASGKITDASVRKLLKGYAATER